MQALITYEITEQNFELIRNTIGSILALELAEQFSITGNSLFDVKVFAERALPVEPDEGIVVNVLFNQVPYDTKTHTNRTGNNEYFIDVHVSGKDKAGGDRGDVRARKNLAKLLGVIANILESGEYLQLGLTPGIMVHKAVSNIAIAEPENNQDTLHIAWGRVVFTVRANENVKKLEGTPSEKSTSTVKLNETEKGYKFEIVNTP